ncbi:MAG: hypothetical protein EB015_15610 [Methylocystaceae bacterium]|nr:hypothetical protein [Methylocystaceae bacterium]
MKICYIDTIIWIIIGLTVLNSRSGLSRAFSHYKQFGGKVVMASGIAKALTVSSASKLQRKINALCPMVACAGQNGV